MHEVESTVEKQKVRAISKIKRDKVFKSGPRKICVRQPFL